MMKVGNTTLNIKDDTEVLVADLPELRNMSRGKWVTFMVGTRDVVFAVAGHDENGTHLIRVHKATED